ncbi:MAG TPA: type II toxin-antitoxin system VapC family toxin [Vicinamibacterales bacterium]
MLLDTHVWIWMATDAPGRLGRRTRRLLARATGSRAPFVSTMSVFEIAALHTAGRLAFTRPIERWLRESIGNAELRVIDLEINIAIDAALIPAGLLADPIDRCLVATAREYDVPLLTCDQRILDYASSTGLLRVVDAAA